MRLVNCCFVNRTKRAPASLFNLFGRYLISFAERRAFAVLGAQAFSLHVFDSVRRPDVGLFMQTGILWEFFGVRLVAKAQFDLFGRLDDVFDLLLQFLDGFKSLEQTRVRRCQCIIEGTLEDDVFVLSEVSHQCFVGRHSKANPH